MDRKKNKFGWIWILFFAFFFVGDSAYALIPLLIILAAVVVIALMAVKSGKEQTDAFSHTGRRSYQRTYRPDQFSNADMARISVYLRRYFRTGSKLSVNGVDLRLRDSSFASLSSLDVYQNDAYLCSLNDYGRRNPDAYEDILRQLLTMAEQPQDADVFDADVEEHTEEEKQPEQKKEEVSESQKFIDEINGLNQDIPDEAISNGLYETTALLKQIQTLEKKLPDSKDKLTKLYAYYLPILTKILHQYVNLQDATTDENYESTRKKLNDTIQLINEAMRNIISSMADSDFINLSADMSTLETLLRKDGLTDDGKMNTKEGSQDE